jgi:hypothetical protein
MALCCPYILVPAGAYKKMPPFISYLDFKPQPLSILREELPCVSFSTAIALLSAVSVTENNILS